MSVDADSVGIMALQLHFLSNRGLVLEHIVLDWILWLFTWSDIVSHDFKGEKEVEGAYNSVLCILTLFYYS